MRLKAKSYEKFGIVIDGWSEGNRHHIAVFDSYAQEEKSKLTLLAIAPPFDGENYDAASHKAFIEDVLGLFNKDFTNLIHSFDFQVRKNVLFENRLLNRNPMTDIVQSQLQKWQEHLRGWYLKSYRISILMYHFWSPLFVPKNRSTCNYQCLFTGSFFWVQIF